MKMKAIFGNLFGDNVARPLGSTATEIRMQMEEAKQREVNLRGIGWTDTRSIYNSALGLQTAASPKYTLTPAIEMQEWQKAQLEMQAAKAAEEKKRARDALDLPHNACSISVAIDLWVVQFGDGWVYIGDIPDTAAAGEINWHQLGNRLAAIGRLEARINHWRIVT
jgi:hypothetical protein